MIAFLTLRLAWANSGAPKAKPLFSNASVAAERKSELNVTPELLADDPLLPNVGIIFRGPPIVMWGGTRSLSTGTHSIISMITRRSLEPKSLNSGSFPVMTADVVARRISSSFEEKFGFNTVGVE